MKPICKYCGGTGYFRWQQTANMCPCPCVGCTEFAVSEITNRTGQLLALTEAPEQAWQECGVPENIAPGMLRCAKCNFQLIKKSLNMNVGTVTAGDSKTEPCPNGCGPLWPMTWQECALQAWNDNEKWFEDLQASKARIAELEAFNKEASDLIASLKRNLYSATQRDITADKLESHQLSVKLPAPVNVNLGGNQQTRAMLSGMNMMLEDCKKAVIAAGGTVE